MCSWQCCGKHGCGYVPLDVEFYPNPSLVIVMCRIKNFRIWSISKGGKKKKKRMVWIECLLDWVSMCVNFDRCEVYWRRYQTLVVEVVHGCRVYSSAGKYTALPSNSSNPVACSWQLSLPVKLLIGFWVIMSNALGHVAEGGLPRALLSLRYGERLPCPTRKVNKPWCQWKG